MSQWYVAKIIMACYVGRSKNASQYDEQVHVIRAKNNEAAYRLALNVGKNEEHSYRNIKGGLIRWRFIGLGELDYIAKSIKSGTEICSTLHGRGKGKHLVMKRSMLFAFWAERNKHKTVLEILSTQSRSPHSTP